MNNQDYWKNRAAWRMYESMEKAEGAADDIAKVYMQASKYLQLGMKGVFEKYQTGHKLSAAEARHLLDSMDSATVQEMLQKLKRGESEKSKRELLAELEAPAYQARISRLEELQKQIDSVMQDIYHQEQQISTAFYERLAEEAYYQSIFEMQQQTGLAFSFIHISQKQIDRVLSMNWSGKYYSDRIWKNTRNLAQTLKEELLVSLLTGRTERETTEVVSDRFASGAMQARRLLRTESCFISGELTARSYEECGIERYRYLAVLDLRTSEICRNLDNKTFPVSERQAGKNYPPMHPWCRSTTIAVISGENLERLTRSAYNPAKGRIEKVPASMNYAEWYKKYVRDVSAEEVAKIRDSDIIKTEAAKEENVMAELQSLGKIDTEILEKEFGKIQTDEIIVTNERIAHIKARHPEDYALFEKYGKGSVASPDMIIKDTKHEGTVFMVKQLPETNLNVVVRVVLETDDSRLKNSVMTFYRIREKNLRKLIEKNGLLYKKE